MKNLTTTSIVFILISFSAYFSKAASVYTSPASGGPTNWGNITWSTTGSGTPVTYIIQSGFTARNNSNRTLGNGDSVIVYGTLTFNNNRDLTIPGSTAFVQVANGGLITGGNGNSQLRVGASTNDGSFNIIGPAYSSNSTTFTSGDALPVTWGYFTGVSASGSNSLSWSTLTEINNSHFEIERAGKDGKFIRIGTINGAGNSMELLEYQFIDNSPMPGVNYYRLKQVDFNQQFEYSDVIELVQTAKKDITVFPTVLGNQELLHIQNIQVNSTIILTSSTGQTLYTVQTPNDAESISFPMNSFQGIRSGHYFITITSSADSKTFKIFVK